MIKNLTSKLYLLLMVLTMPVTVSVAQVTAGVKTGLNLNQFSQPGTTVGATIGVFGTYRISPGVAVKLEPQYSQEGGGRPDYTRYYSSVSDNISTITFVNPSVTFHTVQVPLLIELSLPEMAEESIKPKLILGGSYGLAIAAMEQHTKRYSFVDGTLPASDPSLRLDVAYQKENVSDSYKRNQWSLYLGMGLDFRTASRTFSFDVRYRQGLNNLNLNRFSSPGTTTSSSGVTEFIGVPGTGGNLYSSSVSLNFSMTLFNF